MTLTQLTNVLAWINDVRAQLGLDTLADIPQGKRTNKSECPIAKALNGGNGITAVRAGSIQATVSQFSTEPGTGGHKDTIFTYPIDVVEFVMRVDTGLLPEYEAATA